MTEETLFAAALERTVVSQRQAFLDEACAGKITLRQRVVRLLAADEKARGVLDQLEQSPVFPGDGFGPPPVGQTREDRGALVAGRYELLELIGEGGMGTVWLAEQMQPVRRKVALKLVRAGLYSRSVLARFEAERQALALMDHPSIARVLDADTTDGGRPFFVMEYVEGVPITQHCDDARLSIHERLELFVSVCQAIQHAHQKGIIHRDLKPSNVLVACYDGKAVPKVIDFGVSKAIGPKPEELTTLTRFGQLLGTPLYMSPEQAGMGGLDVDARSDIYSLGALLYELLTGSTPFEWKSQGEATLHQLLRKIREDEPPKPSSRLAAAKDLAAIADRRGMEPARLDRQVRGDLDWIVMKALEKDRTRRYETASALALDLRHYLDDEPVTAFRPSLGLRMRKFVRRNRGPVLAAAAVVLTLVVGVVGTTWGMFRATRATAAARQSERDATEKLFVALLNQARAGRSSRQMGQRLDSLAAITRAARIRRDERLRDEAIAAMALPDIRRVPLRRPLPAGTAAVGYGGQYRVYARADAHGATSIRSLPDDREIQRIGPGLLNPDYRLYFSPDERFLVGFGAGRELLAWRVADGRPALRHRPPRSGAHVFSPDGRQLAVGQDDSVIVFDLATGEELRHWRLPGPANSLAFHPQGAMLAVGYTESRVVSVHDTASGAVVAELPIGEMSRQIVAWHPDGDRLAVGGSDPRIQVWRVSARQQVASLESHVSQVADLTFHPEGGLLASYSWDGVLRLWDPSTGRALLQLPLTLEGFPRFSRDGRWLGAAKCADDAELLEVTASHEYRTLVSSAGAGRGSYNQGDFSPDGRLLAVAMNEGTRLWDLETGRELATLPLGNPYACFDVDPRAGAASSPDGHPRAALLTCGRDGLLRWPITADDADGRRLRLLPPTLLSSMNRASFTRGADGRALGAALIEGRRNAIVDLQTGTVRRELDAHPQGEVRAISGDGRWAASCGWHSDRVWLWNLDTGERVEEWVTGKHANVAFSADSRALIIARDDEFSFWDVDSLQPVRRFRREVAHHPGHVAHSSDRTLTAMEIAPAVIHVMEASSGRTVARLEDPYGDRATWQGFSPDGTRLVVVSGHDSAIHVWDLRAVRARLKEMKLDWDWPEFPPAATAGTVAAPLTVEVPGPELIERQRIERLRRRIEADPNSAIACNGLAWTYLTGPESLRNVDAAVPLAEKAVRLAAGVPGYRNTLGVAYYRAGRYREAADVLRANLGKHNDLGLAFDLYFLAMSHHRLGETARARDYYDWAARWAPMHRDLRPDLHDELAAFRAEAEEVLGIDRPEHDGSTGADRDSAKPANRPPDA